MRTLLHIVRGRQEKRAGALAPIMHAISGDEEESREPVSTLYTPVSKSELAGAAALQVGAPYVASRLGLFGKPMTLGEAAVSGFGPHITPFAALFEAGGALLSPLSDPAYQSDRIGYLKSLGRGIQKNVRQVGEASQYARENYGALGVPIQVFHGILNPLHSTGYMAKEIGKYMMGKSGEAVAVRAEAGIQEALEV